MDKSWGQGEVRLCLVLIRILQKKKSCGRKYTGGRRTKKASSAGEEALVHGRTCCLLLGFVTTTFNASPSTICHIVERDDYRNLYLPSAETKQQVTIDFYIIL